MSVSALGGDSGFGIAYAVKGPINHVFGWTIFIVSTTVVILLAWTAFWWVLRLLRGMAKYTSVHLYTSVLVTLFLLHPTLTKASLRLLTCRTVADRSFLEADFSVSCDDDTHVPFRVLGTLVLIFFTLGVPVVYFFKMFQLVHKPSGRQLTRGMTNVGDLESHELVYGYLYKGFVGRA